VLLLLSISLSNNGGFWQLLTNSSTVQENYWTCDAKGNPGTVQSVDQGKKLSLYVWVFFALLYLVTIGMTVPLEAIPKGKQVTEL
jgi:hypothetical protein